MVVGAGQGKRLYGAGWVMLTQGTDEGAHRGAGGEDVVDEKEGGGGGDAGVGDELIDVLEL